MVQRNLDEGKHKHHTKDNKLIFQNLVYTRQLSDSDSGVRAKGS